MNGSASGYTGPETNEVTMDFSVPYGIDISYHDTSWTKLPTLSPEAVCTENMDTK
jgi:hypothetical protein